MALTLCRILIHGKHAKDDILVLDRTGADQLLEAVPVLSGELGIDICLHLVLLQLLGNIVCRGVLTLLSQFLVEVIATFRRSVSADFNVLQTQRLLVVVDLLEDGDEVLHAGAVDLAGTDIGLIDEVLDLCLLFLANNTLVSVSSLGRMGGADGLTKEATSGNNAIAHLYIRELDGFITQTGIEAQIEVALLHLV